MRRNIAYPLWNKKIKANYVIFSIILQKVAVEMQSKMITTYCNDDPSLKVAIQVLFCW